MQSGLSGAHTPATTMSSQSGKPGAHTPLIAPMSDRNAQCDASIKAPVAKPGVPFVIGERQPGIQRLLEAEAQRRGAVPIVATPPSGQHAGGPLGRENEAVAMVVLNHLPDGWRPDPESLGAGIARCRLPGRFDRRGRWLLDVAHNPAAVTRLAQSLRDSEAARPLHAVVGIVADKDWSSMLERLLGAVDAIWITSPPSVPPERRRAARCS